MLYSLKNRVKRFKIEEFLLIDTHFFDCLSRDTFDFSFHEFLFLLFPNSEMRVNHVEGIGGRGDIRVHGILFYYYKNGRRREHENSDRKWRQVQA